MDIETHEQREQRLFEESYAKQSRISKKVLKIVFCVLGAIYAAVGVIVYFVCDNGVDGRDSEVFMCVFGGLGVLFIALGVLLPMLIPDKPNYAKYLKQVSSYGAFNNFALMATIDTQKEQIRYLEDKVSDLTRRVEDLEGYRR